MNAPASGGGRTGGPRALGAVLLLVVLIALLAAMNAGLLGSALAPSAIRRTIDRTGAFAPVLYLLLFAFGTNLMLTASLLAIGGGLAFGWGRALGLTLVGSLGGFVIGYAVSAALLRAPVRTLLARLGWLGTLEQLERLPPTRLSFASRFIPIPVGAQNLLLGLTRLPLLPYLLGSFAGSLPWMLVFTGMGGAASGSFRFPFWAGAGVGLVMMLLADRWWSRRGHRDIPESSSGRP